MNLLVLGLASQPFGTGEIPVRDACVLVFLFAGIALLLIGTYLLFAGSGSGVYPIDPIRADD